MLHSTVAILGVGPRGISILERLLTLYSHYPFSGNIDILLIDPNEMGTGTHSVHQPDHLLVNTVACQITLFGDDTVKGVGPIRKGPNFYQWAIQQGYRNINGVFSRTEHNVGKEIKENDYLSRRLLGEYLSWAYQELTQDLPSGIRIKEIRQKVINLYIHQDNKTDILLEDGYRYSVDFVYITTGHGKNTYSSHDESLQQFVAGHQMKNALLNYYSNPYPIEKLDSIQSQSRVLVQGIGLTSYDVLSQLTYGRGGTFTENAGQLCYMPSGKEPKIALFSRQTLPFSSRGINQKGGSGQYIPSFLTLDAIHHLRKQSSIANGSPKLDFETQLLPLLLKEMCYVYRSTQLGHWLDPETYVVTSKDEQCIQALLYPHRNKIFASLKDYTRFFMEHLKDDLHSSAAGNVDGPVKAATDVLRDVRDILRSAIDFCGLTSSSHKYFIEYFNPNFNRISVGPPMQRNQELKALMEAGIVTLAGGPSPKLVLNASTSRFEIQSVFQDENSSVDGDVLITAKIDSFSPLRDESPFIKNLAAQGIIRPFINQGYHPGGIDIDCQQHPIDTKGQVQNTLWVVGNPVEGANFYTYILPRPLVNSRALRDAGHCVIDMYEQLLNRHSVKDSTINVH
ncbi:FAD/NAD(P)-binding protein [Bartonella sp. MR168JLCBS]|uniref:FAD/NAD(P)-binding protein n=1 Tax=Bartonella sp. MR168JLCBS TaxID=3243556 RepID=UPI0035CF3803